MKSAGRLALSTLCCFLMAASSAHAENWVRVIDNPNADLGDEPSFVDVDTHSIRRGNDGLVYFNMREDLGVSPSAIDCQKKLYYVIGDGSWDWKASPSPIKPGSDSAKEADVVCSEAA